MSASQIHRFLEKRKTYRSSETDPRFLTTREYSSLLPNLRVVSELELFQIGIESARLEHVLVTLLIHLRSEQNVISNRGTEKPWLLSCESGRGGEDSWIR